MRKIRLNGEKMTDRENAHAYLKKQLDLPDYYGKNLDALWDCLTTDFLPFTITLCNFEKLIDNLGGYGDALIKLLKDAAEENRCMDFEIEVGDCIDQERVENRHEE